MSGTSTDTAFDLLHFFLTDPPCAKLFVDAPTIGDTDFAIAPVSIQHWTTGDHQRRHIYAGRAHEIGGDRFVATGEHDHTVDRICPDCFFDIHRHEVAI